MRVLGIETSCDETGAAVFEAGRGIVAERLSSQVDIHAAFGGVVPELASRDHIAKLAPLLNGMLAEANLSLNDLDAIAYTAGPGLIGALMVGGSFAASLAYGLDVPAVPVHHMEGHLLACMLEAERPDFPFVALLVSGGHTQLVQVAGVGRYRILGETLDDAAGEAFDKVARLLSLPYPGGPALAALADTGNPERFALPRPLVKQGLDFSFSGLKTAVRLVVESCRTTDNRLEDRDRADIAASFQAAAVDSLVAKSKAALEATGSRAPRGGRRRGREPESPRATHHLRSAGRRSRVLSATGLVHGQWRHDRVRGLAKAHRRAVGSAAHRRETAVAAR